MKSISTRSVRRQGTAAVIVLLVLVGLPALLSGQENADTTLPRIDLEYTWAVFGTDEDFRMHDGYGVVEFSFSFPESSVHFGSRDRGVLVIEAELRNLATGEESFSIWPVTVEKGEGTAKNWVMALERVELPSGEYQGSLRVYNAGQKDRADSTLVEFEVPDYRRSEFAIADIEFITNRRPAEGGRHRFRRGSDILFRNIRSIVVPPDNYLHAYTELYNTDRLVQKTYHVFWVITDTAGRPMFSLDSLVETDGDSVEVLFQSFRLASVPGGVYYLLLRVYEGNRLAATDSASSIRSFYVYRPAGIPIADGNGSDAGYIIDPLYAGLTEEELDLEFRKASYIIPEFQQEIYNGLSGTEAKGRFLTNFWATLDDDPKTVDHPVRDDYYRRVEYASNYFRSGLTPRGWDSDRGRILLRYGTPDGVERHPNDFNRRPFEIWTYSSSRASFVFVDISQTGNYILVHSTAPSEIRNLKWEREHAQMHDDPNEDSALDQRGRVFGE